jgi:AcrR family transcriptional regulator
MAKKKSRIALSRERIEEAAEALIERDGLEVFSTRRLAAELDCEAMSIYHHFPNKAELLEALVARFFDRLPLPEQGLAPVERLRRIAWSYRDAALKQPNLFPLVAMHRLSTPVGIAWLERMFGVMLDAVPQRATAASLMQAYGSYIVGACLDETQGRIKGGSDEGTTPDRGNFDAGLEIILGGIEQSLGKLQRAD